MPHDMTKSETRIIAQKIVESWYCHYGMANGIKLCKKMEKIFKKERRRRKKLEQKSRK